MHFSYTTRSEDHVAGLFCEKPASDNLSFEGRHPSTLGSYPGMIFADLQAESEVGGFCFMREIVIPTPKVGDTFGRWAVEALLPKRFTACRCECGNTAKVKIADLHYNKSTKCRPCVKLHGACRDYRRSPEYTAWQDMQRFCSGSDPTRDEYRTYFLKGIKIAPEWFGVGGFQRFLAHVGLRPTPLHLLNRFDKTTGFEPGNVRWATRKEHGRSTAKNVLVTYQGRTQPRTAWAEEIGIPSYILRNRAVAGWSVGRALTTPVSRGLNTYCCNGHEYTPENSYISKGKRQCRACRRAHGKQKKLHIKRATPDWLTREQRRAIRAIYLSCPLGYEVDHEIPLRGVVVCGLHVPWNLRAIPALDNMRKGNKLVVSN